MQDGATRRGTGLWRLVALLLVVWAGLALLLLLPGGMAVNAVEGDVLHALDGAMRLVGGARPHLDFATPLGVLSFATIAVPLALGAGPGTSLALANLAMALVLIPHIVWLRATRLGPRVALAFGIWAMAEAAALIHDSSLPGLTFAMHYNRWGWAIFSLAFLLLVLPSRRGPDWVDGALLGLCGALLALIKMTYLMALVAPALAWVVTGRRWGAGGAALAAGLAAAILVTLWAGGPGYWIAYARDLIMVAGSEMRARPGAPLLEVLGAPHALPATIALLGSIVALRLAGARAAGLMLFLAAPGMIYVTYQNWGNAPVWLVPLGVTVWSLRARLADGARVLGRPARLIFAALALVAGVEALPLVFNTLASPWRQLAIDRADYLAPLQRPGWDDLVFASERGTRMRAQVPLGTPDRAALDRRGIADDLPVTFSGRSYPACSTTWGLVGQLRARAALIGRHPALAVQPGLAADLINAEWMFTGGPPLLTASPWYYGGATGAATAGWVLVPRCPFSPLARALALEALSGSAWVEVEADATAVLYVPAR